MASKIAVEFVRSVLSQNPHVNNFGTVYDLLSRAAAARSFHNLGYEELAMAGISFSLLSTNQLEQVITEARQTMSLESYVQH